MKNEPKLYESQLYDIWKNQSFSKKLQTKTGDKIEVLDTGIHNVDSSGADFKNARVRVGNLTYVGDIEIDIDYRDWKTHGHNIDNNYNRVVLHASMFNKFNHPYVYTKDGRKVPSICLREYLNDERITNSFKFNGSSDKKNRFLKCIEVHEKFSKKQKEKFLLKLGIKRFNKKCSRIYERLKELTYLKELNIKEPVIKYDLCADFQKRKFSHNDFQSKEIWQQLLYEIIFEALGYSKNKSIMMHLAQAANIEFLTKLGDGKEFIERLESAFFNIGGLVPNVKKLPDEETSDYSKKLSIQWENIKRIYDGKYFDETQWHFFKLRPQNFPTIRIAGGARIVNHLLYGNLIEIMIKKIKEINNINVLINSLRTLFVVRSEGFWQKHYIFDKAANGHINYFIGGSRADEIIINVILPFFSVYFDVFGYDSLSKKILTMYSQYYQKGDNKIVRDVSESLDMVGYTKKTIYQQGMLELFRNYCSKNKCMECEIGNEVFS